MNFERFCWVMLAAACLKVGQWFPEAEKHRQEQATVASGIYRPAPPSPRMYLNCTPEGREACKLQARLGKVKA